MNFSPDGNRMFLFYLNPDSPDGSRRHHPRAWKSWRKRGFLLSPTAQLTLLGSDSASPWNRGKICLKY